MESQSLGNTATHHSVAMETAEILTPPMDDGDPPHISMGAECRTWTSTPLFRAGVFPPCPGWGGVQNIQPNQRASSRIQSLIIQKYPDFNKNLLIIPKMISSFMEKTIQDDKDVRIICDKDSKAIMIKCFNERLGTCLKHIKKISLGFPCGSVLKNQPANAGNTGSIRDLQMPQSN